MCVCIYIYIYICVCVCVRVLVCVCVWGLYLCAHAYEGLREVAIDGLSDAECECLDPEHFPRCPHFNSQSSSMSRR